MSHVKLPAPRTVGRSDPPGVVDRPVDHGVGEVVGGAGWWLVGGRTLGAGGGEQEGWVRHDPSSFEVPAALWDRPEMVAALSARDVGRVFRLVRQHAGASQTGFMAALRSRWRGRRA